MKTAVSLLGRMRHEYGFGPEAPTETRKASPGLVLAMLDEATEAGLRGLSSIPADKKVLLGRLLVEIRDVRRRLHRAPSSSGVVGAADFAGAIRRLRGAETVAGLSRSVCSEAAAMTGLGCVLLSEVHDNAWTIVETQFEQGSAPDVSALASTAIAPGSPEEEAVHKRAAVLVLPTPQLSTGNSTAVAGVSVFGAGGYVVAPIAVSTGVIGLIHACRADERKPSVAERDLLDAFADSFGTLFERALVSERLSEQKRLIVERLQEESREAEGLSTAEVVFGKPRGAGVASLSPGPLPSHLRAPGLEELTRREREVFQLLAAGKSNTEIADELVISVFTVKSHVKKILRKLGAMNRSEAIYRYLEMIDSGSDASSRRTT
ncbi:MULTISPECIES: helix-turn-helix transcriptional regulator [unclassified Rhodococcus (in: high G+C Gram-positive bacteria)]|uniref:helix-turn-helix transcriptional regulator n=1 Tax=unclassified Rhodococcus (in: high G+C Gram-positive bacteria) TaxID=192944 RepID=UPI00249DED22|nr:MULTISPECIES: helix-turn-helix transcriptional regulator [unclassified Rhodococcus (in: high G+C Gram-positive bacteria)]